MVKQLPIKEKALELSRSNLMTVRLMLIIWGFSLIVLVASFFHEHLKQMQKILSKLILISLLINASYIQAKASFSIATMNSPDHILIKRIVKKAYQKLDVEVRFVELPGKRALMESSSGRLDGELSRVLQVGVDYPSLKRVPTSMFWFDATAFSKNIDSRIDSWDSLKGFRIGIMRGMVFSENGVKGFPNVTIVDKPRYLFNLLKEGRVDLVIFSSLNGIYMLKKMKFDQKEIRSTALERINAYHYVHKKHEALVSKLDRVFQDMIKSGEIEAMRQSFVHEISD